MPTNSAPIKINKNVEFKKAKTKNKKIKAFESKLSDSENEYNFS